MDVSDLSVLLELLDDFPDSGDSAILEETFEHLQKSCLFFVGHGFLELGDLVGFSPSLEALAHVSGQVSEQLHKSLFFELSFAVLNESVVDHGLDRVVQSSEK